METLRDSGLILNKRKCKLYRREVKILGILVSHKVVKLAKDKIEALNSFKTPVNLRELSSFLRLINFCRKFIQGVSQKTASLKAVLIGKARELSKRSN